MKKKLLRTLLCGVLLLGITGCNKVKNKITGNTYSYTYYDDNKEIAFIDSYTFNNDGTGDYSRKDNDDKRFNQETDFKYKVNKNKVTVYEDSYTSYFTYEKEIDCLIDSEDNRNYCIK